MNKCKTCMWYLEYTNMKELIEKYNMLRAGTCRRRSPIGDGFTSVHEDDWCGEHSDKE